MCKIFQLVIQWDLKEYKEKLFLILFLHFKKLSNIFIHQYEN